MFTTYISIAIGEDLIKFEEPIGVVDDRVDIGRPRYFTEDASVKYIKNVLSNTTAKELKKCVETSQHRIYVDSLRCPDLNVAASITFYNVDLENPRLHKNGVWRPDIFLLRLNQNTYTAFVDGFSEYTLVDSSFADGQFYNMSLQNGNLVAGFDSFFTADFETSTPQDRGQFQNQLLNQGATFTAGGGAYGSNAYYFDGVNDDITMPSQNKFNFTANASVTWVIRFSNNHTPAVALTGIWTNRQSTNGVRIQMDQLGRLDFFTGHGASNSNCVTVNANYSDNGWHTAIFEYNSSNYKNVYVDGALNQSCNTNSLGEWAFVGINVSIGSVSGTSNFFKGFIDDVQVFNRTLSQAEILAFNSSQTWNIHKKQDMNWSKVKNFTFDSPKATSVNVTKICLTGNLSNLTIYGRNATTPEEFSTWYQAFYDPLMGTQDCYNFTQPLLNAYYFQYRLDGVSDGNSTFAVQSLLINYSLAENMLQEVGNKTFIQNSSSFFEYGKGMQIVHNISKMHTSGTYLNGSYQSYHLYTPLSTVWTQLNATFNACYKCKAPDDGVETGYVRNFNGSNLTSIFHMDQPSGALNNSFDPTKNLTVNGNPGYKQTGVLDWSIAFDGNDYFLGNVWTQYMNSSKKTISLWMKPNATFDGIASYAGRTVVSDWSNYWGIFVTNISGQDCIWVYNYDGNADQVCIPYVKNEWAHIVMTHNGSTLTAYKNGVYYNSTDSGQTSNQLAQLVIGKVTNGYQGFMDEILLYNRSISADEVANLYERGAHLINISYRQSNLADFSDTSWNYTEMSQSITPNNLTTKYFQFNYTFSTTSVIFPVIHNITLLNIFQSIPDTIKPLVNFTFPTPSNASIQASYIIVYNVTAEDETTLKNISVYLFNSSFDLINVSNTTISSLFGNFTVQSDGTYHINATAYDLSGNGNVTELREIIILTAAPAPVGGAGAGFSFTSTLKDLFNFSLFEDENEEQPSFLSKVYDFFISVKNKITSIFDKKEIIVSDGKQLTNKQKEKTVMKFSLISLIALFSLIFILILAAKYSIPWWVYIGLAIILILIYLFSSDTTSLVLDKTNGGWLKWSG